MLTVVKTGGDKMPVKECEHIFLATAKKGKWKVRAFGTNNRGRISIEEVTTTLFRCKRCGAIKEFPDNWEWNYLAPGKNRHHAVQRQRSPKLSLSKKHA